MRICELRRDGFQWVFETDIENFFPSINRQKLLPEVFSRLPDGTLNTLIEAAIDTSISNYEDMGARQELWDPTSGVPQGGILSPILANFYLYNVDRTITAAGFKLIRYVDDLIILCRSGEEARGAYNALRDALDKLDLRIHPLGQESNGRIKTRIHQPGESFEFLGLTFSANSIRPAERKILKLEERIEEITDSRLTRDRLVDIVLRVNACLIGWMQAYKFCNLKDGDLRRINEHVSICVRRWMCHRGILKKEKHLTASGYPWLGVRSAFGTRIEPILRRKS
jgi:RNA-directed DNA polymerase